MKSPEELAKEITDKAKARRGKGGFIPYLSYVKLREEIAEAIRLDRLSIRKRCAEVVRAKIQECNDDKHDPCYCHQEDAKAIEEMEL